MYDVLIVGAGTAGMACAITAAGQGAKVGVVEKSDHIGGALHWSGGHMSAGGTRLQKSRGIDDSPEKHYQDIININGSSGDLELIKLAVEEAPRTINWLEDLGFDFAPECPRIIYGHVPYTLPRTHYGTNKALSIYEVLKPLWDDQIKKGNIDLFLHHEWKGLEQNNNQFNEVITENSDGEKSFFGQNIVLTTGGYGSNPSFFSQKHPNTPLMSSTYPSATGDGHQIIEKIGGRFQYAEMHLPSLGGVELAKGRCNFNEAWAMVLTSVYRQPREIYVNNQGFRFMREDEINADTRERLAIQQPGWTFWLIFDEAALLERMENGIENPIMIGWDTEKIKAAALEERFLWKADSIASLCQKTGLPYNNLNTTISGFNTIVDQGNDHDFGREYLKNKVEQAPYYALQVHASVLVTFGGMKVNPQLQLLDQAGKIMPGLYGAGEFLGLGATSGSAFCSGMAITPALSFGRILGKTLTK